MTFSKNAVKIKDTVTPRRSEDVCEKEIEKQDGSLSDGDRHKTDVSPDKCVVTFLKNAVKIKDTVTPR